MTGPKIEIVERIVAQALTANRHIYPCTVKSNKELAKAIAERLYDILGIGTKPDDSPTCALWHIYLYVTNGLQTDEVACRSKGTKMGNGGYCRPVADFPFQVTCPDCKKICDELLANGNPENWPVGEDEEQAKKDYRAVCAHQLFGY